MKQQQLYYIIGRSETCDVQLFDDLVSREHATLRVGKGDKFYIMDHSTNGTYLNGIRLQSEVEYEVDRGARIDFAHVETLDWNYIPKKKAGAGKFVLITLCIVILVAGLSFGIWYFVTNYSCDNHKETEKVIEQEQKDSLNAIPATVPETISIVPDEKPQVTKPKESPKKPTATKTAVKASETEKVEAKPTEEALNLDINNESQVEPQPEPEPEPVNPII